MITTEIEFSDMIMQMASENRSGVMEALIKYCDENYIEFEEVKPLLTPVVIDQLREEFEDINMLKFTPKFDI